ncbi:D-aspartate oxidase-like [Photinus pyralis]|nr:D-aspartate oxidase-like [Photinus pyralis]
MHSIAVIGAGVIGLSAATALQEHLPNVTVTIYAEKISPNLTSNVAAGMWAPFLYQKTDGEKILSWGRGSHDQFLKLWKGGHASEAGICLQLVKSLSADIDLHVGQNIVWGEQQMPPEEVEFLTKLLKKDFRTAVNYVSFTCEPSRYLPFLQKRFIQNGGKIVIRKIKDFRELSHYNLVVNCTGLGAQELTDDTQMTPIRGTAIRVKAPWLFHSLMDDDIYIILNADTCVLGTTAQYGDYELNPRESETKNINNFCNSLVPALENAEYVKTCVGLRPGRVEVRLETEIQDIDGKLLPIVHNYGHGGCGVTLSYGCALNVVDLVREALRIPYSSKL